MSHASPCSHVIKLVTVRLEFRSRGLIAILTALAENYLGPYARVLARYAAAVYSMVPSLLLGGLNAAVSELSI